MKVTQKNIKWSSQNRYAGSANGFNFTIAINKVKWYVVADHKKKDIRFNSLWSNLEFDSLELATAFCESFDYTKHNCLGNDL